MQLTLREQIAHDEGEDAEHVGGGAGDESDQDTVGQAELTFLEVNALKSQKHEKQDNPTQYEPKDKSCVLFALFQVLLPLFALLLQQRDSSRPLVFLEISRFLEMQLRIVHRGFDVVVGGLDGVETEILLPEVGQFL